MKRSVPRLKSVLRERTVDVRGLRWNLRFLTLLGYVSVAVMLGGTLFLELFGNQLSSVRVEPDAFTTMDFSAGVRIPVLALVLSSLSLALGWAFLLTGATDCRRRVFFPIVGLFCLQWVMFVGRGGGIAGILGFGGLLIIAAVSIAYLFFPRLRYWRDRPLVEFGIWLTLLLLVVAEMFFANTKTEAALDLNLALSIPQMVSIPFWVLLGVEAVDGAATLVRYTVLRLRRWLAGGIFTAVLFLVLLIHSIASLLLANYDGGWWIFDFCASLPLLVAALALGAFGRLTARASSILLALSLIAPILTFAGAQTFGEKSLTTWGLSVVGISANILPAALIFVGLAAYDVLNFGARYVNTDGHVMPRSGRVLLYFGAVLLVTAFTLFYLNAHGLGSNEPHRSLLLLINMPFTIGVWFLGLPYLAWLVWKRREHLIGEHIDIPASRGEHG